MTIECSRCGGNHMRSECPTLGLSISKNPGAALAELTTHALGAAHERAMERPNRGLDSPDRGQIKERKPTFDPNYIRDISEKVYRLELGEDDSWETDGRRTYLHEDDATRAYLTTLRGILGRQGWQRDPSSLRTFRHASGQIIEIEPGGVDCTGHYLHHMKAVDA